ncbi:MAG: hypothetical protein IJ408_04985 [Clostridia bacterium]|nr:hypothetical protein [Clostridia bacterium]
MTKIRIADTTLCKESAPYSFKEKIEIARQLEKLCVDVIELPQIENAKTDILFVRTASSFVKNSILSVAAGITAESIDNAAMALSGAAKPRIRIELPVSTVGMEYTCHKKAPKMLEWIKIAVAKAKESCSDVEFAAVDATRADKDFLSQAISAAVEAGATGVAVIDSAAEMMPDDFAKFAGDIASSISVPLAVATNNKNGLACADAILAVKSGASTVKTAVNGETAPLETFAVMLKNCGNSCGFSSDIKYTELHRIAKQILWISDNAKSAKSAVTVADDFENTVKLDGKDDRETVTKAVAKLGYDLSDEDNAKVYEEFLRVAEKKTVGPKELEAIVASVALQVPATYVLENYVINTGNIISASAQITLNKDGNKMQGISIGDGPIDAAFLAIEQIIGYRYELDDFQIQSVTEGTEAMGSALVKLRSNGKLYSGNGISTDILGASIRAYINAVNKIVYEEV